MTIRIALLGMLLAPLTLPAQQRANKHRRPVVVEAPPPPAIIMHVDQQAEFSGDPTAWVNGHLRYPEAAREEGFQGRAHVRFTVQTDGKVGAVGIARSSGIPVLDSEACRVIRTMPAWRPARSDGRPLASKLLMPVRFRIE